MGVMGFISKDSAMSITFQADNTNTKSTVLLAWFLPIDGEPEIRLIAPGGVDTITFEDLPDVEELRILVNTPEPSGTGRLVVLEDDNEKNNEPIVDDTIWSYIVVTE